LEEVGAQARAAVGREPYVAVDHHGLDRRHRREHRLEAGELPAIEGARLVRGDVAHEDDTRLRLGGRSPTLEQDAVGGGAAGAVAYVEGGDHRMLPFIDDAQPLVKENMARNRQLGGVRSEVAPEAWHLLLEWPLLETRPTEERRHLVERRRAPDRVD